MALSSIILLAMVVGLAMAQVSDDGMLKTWTEKVEDKFSSDVQPATLIGDYTGSSPIKVIPGACYEITYETREHCIRYIDYEPVRSDCPRPCTGVKPVIKVHCCKYKQAVPKRINCQPKKCELDICIMYDHSGSLMPATNLIIKVSQLFLQSTIDPRFTIIKHAPGQTTPFSASQTSTSVNNVIASGDPFHPMFMGANDFTGSLKACKDMFPNRPNAKRVAVTITDGCFDYQTGNIANAGVANSQAMAPAAGRFIEMISTFDGNHNYHAAVGEFVKKMETVCQPDFEYPKTVNNAFKYTNAVCQPSKLARGCATEDELVAAEGRN